MAEPFAEIFQQGAMIDWSQLGEQFQEFLVARGPHLATNLLGASVIFVLGSWFARAIIHLLAGILQRARVEPTLAKFLCRLGHALIMIVVAVAGLDRLGINTTSLAAVLAAASLAVGMALQGSLSNFAAGIMMIVFRPFKVGDLIETGGARGVVEEVHMFNTLLRTADNVLVIIPNSSVTSSNITNFSTKPTRRIDLVVDCGYGDDLRGVKQLLSDILAQHPRVLSDPPPVVAVGDLGDHSVQILVRPWVATTDFLKVRCELIEQIKLGYDEHGYQIPFPQRDIHVFHQRIAQPVDSAAELPGSRSLDVFPLPIPTPAGIPTRTSASSPGSTPTAVVDSTLDLTATPNVVSTHDIAPAEKDVKPMLMRPRRVRPA
jgi:small conductance mechanosensitive channel